MKRILILIFIFLPIVCFAENWDANVKAVFMFENNGNDDTGSYSLLQAGTPLFYTDNVHTGTYSHGSGGQANSFRLSSDLKSYMATLDEWTIQFYYFISRDSVWNFTLMADWTNGSDTMGLMFRSDAVAFVEAGYNNSFTSVSNSMSGWHRINLEWTGTQAKYYIDGSLIFTFNSTTNIFDVSSKDFWLMTALYTPDMSSNARIDDLIVSDIARGGSDVTPVVFTATPTATPTFTDSPTFTVTPTFTPTFTATPTPTITETCGLCVVYSDWEVLTKNAYNYNIPTGRVGHQMLNYDGKMWIIGGIKDSSLTQNDVWYSINGVDWTLATGNAAFGTRSYFCSTVFDNKMWVMGGFSPTENYRDVWYSINGVDWTLATGNAAFGARNYSKVLSYNNKMYILLGTYDNQTFYTDVWESLDGVIWTETTANCGIGERDAHQAIVFDGKMWIIGGETYNGYIFYKDAWYSSNGADWTAATQNTAFGHRSYGNLLSLNGYMWLFGGNNRLNYVLENDVWYSVNGVDWYARTLNSACGYRDSAAAVVFNNQLYLSGGILPNGGTPGISDVWTNKIEQYCLSETPTSTVTPTVTPTATPTKTPRLTDTPTPTFTITETNTASPTLTETRDVTARATKTMTLTVIGTVTATRTVIVYALYSPTKTPTICCTKEYIIITPTPTHVSPWIQWGWPW
jgi:hypothetical protein